MAGWRWLFLIEGFPTVILGIIAWFYLPASPATATWLTHDERAFLLARMSTSNPHGDSIDTLDAPHTNTSAPHDASLPSDDSQLLPNGTSSNDDITPISMRGHWQSFKTAFMRVWNTTYRNPFIWLAVFINFTTLFPVVAVRHRHPNSFYRISLTMRGMMVMIISGIILFTCNHIIIWFIITIGQSVISSTIFLCIIGHVDQFSSQVIIHLYIHNLYESCHGLMMCQPMVIVMLN
jgi:hypothetical protein